MISYKPLIRLMAIHNKVYQDLVNEGFSWSTLAKINKGEPFSFDSIERLCRMFNVPIQDIVEVLDPDGNPYVNPNNSEELMDRLIEEQKKSALLEAKVTSLEQQIKDMTKAQSSDLKKRHYMDRFKVKNLREHREAAQLTQEEVALKMSVTKQTVSKWEKELSFISEKHLSEMKTIIKIPKEDIEKKVYKTESKEKI